MHGRPVSSSSLRRQEKFLSSPYEEKEIHRGGMFTRKNFFYFFS